ncbi:unnamed protein product, partial [Prunus brigantina]
QISRPGAPGRGDVRLTRESYFWMRCVLCAGVPARSTVRRGFDRVFVRLFIGRVLESHSRLKRSSKNICLIESDWGKQVVQSTFGIVKHGGVTPINLGKSRPLP